MEIWGNPAVGNCTNAASRCWKPETPANRPWPVAIIENTGVNPDVAGEDIQQYRAAHLVMITMRQGRFVDHRNAGYVIRMAGVVGRRGRVASIYPDP